MITRKFILKIRYYFNKLGIDARTGINYDDFEKKFVMTLNNCKELSDAKLAIYYFLCCRKKWKKIEQIFSKHLIKWQEYNFENSSAIETVSNDDATGTYYITNAFNKNHKNIFFSSVVFENELFTLNYKRGKFFFGDICNEYIKYSKTNPQKMKLFDKNNIHLCNIVLSKSYDIFLDKNHTEYELVINNTNDNSFIGVFNKSYIDSLSDDDYIDFENMIADIEWDLIHKNSDRGVAKITFYQDIDDITIIIYFAASTFLLYKSFRDISIAASLLHT